MDDFEIRQALQRMGRELCRRLGQHDFGEWRRFVDPEILDARDCRTCGKIDVRRLPTEIQGGERPG